MKKILAIMALAISTAALAGGAGVTTEFESEYGKNGGSDSNSVSIAPYYKFDNGIKADVKFEGGRDKGVDAGSNKPIDGLVEARIRKDYALNSKFALGLRLGIGEKINGENKAGNTVDFGYYTIEPMATYKVNDAVSLNTSMRFRSAFSSDQAYTTRTYKVGAAYKVTKEDEVGIKFFDKHGDSRTNGFELTYSRGF